MLGPIIIQQVVKLAKGTARFDAMANDMIAKFELGCPPKAELERIVQQKNTIVTALTQVSGVINTITKIGTTLDQILAGLNIAVNVIKFLPLPLPPFSPALLVTGPAVAVDTLGDLVKAGKGAVKIIPDALSQIASGIEGLITKLGQIDGLLNPCLAEAGLDGSINNEDLNALLNTTGTNSDADVNQATESELLARLQPNSNDPLFYKGYKLEIQNDPKNEFSFASRRVMGEKDKVKLYNLADQGYSYSSSVQVLIDEIKFRIDLNQIPSLSSNPSLALGTSNNTGISSGNTSAPPSGFNTGQGPNRFLGASTIVPSFPNVSGKLLVTTLPAKAKITVNGGSGNNDGDSCFTEVNFTSTLNNGNPNDKIEYLGAKAIKTEKIFYVNFLKKGKYSYNFKITNLNGTDPNKASIEFI